MDRKDQLLDISEALVRQRGYDAFSFADLAAEAGIRKASIHHHFPRKGDLADALVDRYARTIADQLDSMDGPPASQLLALIRFYRAALGDGDQLCLCVSLSLARSSLEDSTLTRVDDFHRMVESWLAERFAQMTGWERAHAPALLAQMEGAQLVARAARNVGRYDDAMALMVKKLGD